MTAALSTVLLVLSAAEGPRPSAVRLALPEPRELELSEIPPPSTAAEGPENLPLFLDALAPLGTREGNAAPWFAEFTREVGQREKQWRKARRRMRRIEGIRAFPPKDPLLLEAERWTDRAEMAFYPDHLRLEGWETRMPNGLFLMDLGRSWLAKGLVAGELEEAYGAFRHAVRLGRLLRAEDATVLQDQLGLGLIRQGLLGFHRVGRREGDALTVLLATSAMAEVDLARRANRRPSDESRAVACGFVKDREDPSLEGVSLRQVEILAGIAGDAERPRRHRIDVLDALWLVVQGGTEAQGEVARGALEEAAADPDPLLAANARWFLERGWDPDLVPWPLCIREAR